MCKKTETDVLGGGAGEKGVRRAPGLLPPRAPQCCLLFVTSVPELDPVLLLSQHTTSKPRLSSNVPAQGVHPMLSSV